MFSSSHTNSKSSQVSKVKQESHNLLDFSSCLLLILAITTVSLSIYSLTCIRGGLARVARLRSPPRPSYNFGNRHPFKAWPRPTSPIRAITPPQRKSASPPLTCMEIKINPGPTSLFQRLNQNQRNGIQFAAINYSPFLKVSLSN